MGGLSPPSPHHRLWLWTRTTMKMLMSKLERSSFGEALLVRMAIISLHVNVKTPFLLLSRFFNNPLHANESSLIRNLSKFWRLTWGGGQESRVGEGVCPPPRWLRPCEQRIKLSRYSILVVHHNISMLNGFLNARVIQYWIYNSTVYQCTENILYTVRVYCNQFMCVPPTFLYCTIVS